VKQAIFAYVNPLMRLELTTDRHHLITSHTGYPLLHTAPEFVLVKLLLPEPYLFMFGSMC